MMTLNSAHLWFRPIDFGPPITNNYTNFGPQVIISNNNHADFGPQLFHICYHFILLCKCLLNKYIVIIHFRAEISKIICFGSAHTCLCTFVVWITYQICVYCVNARCFNAYPTPHITVNCHPMINYHWAEISMTASSVGRNECRLSN